MTEQPEQLAGNLLRAANLTLAVAESCTGGLLGNLLTDVSGSSAYFLGGVIAYHDSLKTNLLDVSPDLIDEYGAVSAECALALANGVRSLTGADVGVSITGVAGPDGGTEAKPVGTVFIAIASPNLQQVARHQWQGDRLSNKQQSVDAALLMLIESFGNLKI